MYKIYTTETCPRCAEIKAFFKRNGLPFEEMDLNDPENLTYLRVRAVFAMTSPILEDTDKNKFYLADEIEELMSSVRV